MSAADTVSSILHVLGESALDVVPLFLVAILIGALIEEFVSEREGYEAVKHQEFVGVGYFDEVTQIVHGGRSSTVALEGSTEKAQFVS